MLKKFIFVLPQTREKNESCVYTVRQDEEDHPEHFLGSVPRPETKNWFGIILAWAFMRSTGIVNSGVRPSFASEIDTFACRH